MEVWHGKVCVTASTAHGYGLFGFTLFVNTLLKNLHENQAHNIKFWSEVIVKVLPAPNQMKNF